jgi:ribonuclease P protein component
MREVFRHCRARIQPPLDIVVIAKAEAHKLSYAQAAAELTASLPLSRGG